MNIGFETIGNATLIVYDGSPLLSTDPWIQGSAYFGSWCLSHEIPEAQRTSVLNSKYVWFSHGHPDHLNPECLPLFRNQKILLPDHVGGRVCHELREQGFQVEVLTDRQWHWLSDRVRILCICDFLQDAILLVEVNGRLVVNLNDTAHHAWVPFVKRTIRQYSKSYLLSLSGFGDVDMMNFYKEDGSFILPNAARKDPVGISIAEACESFGTPYFIPFSSFHRYQRDDSIWANEYTTGIEDFAVGFNSAYATLLPSFVRVDCESDTVIELRPEATPAKIYDPKEFGDNWSDCLDKKDIQKCQSYFGSVGPIRDYLDFIKLRVGGVETTLDLSKSKTGRGVTFEVPRHSLMTCVEYRIFDDLLIGNFMKTTLHGDWPVTKLYPNFTPFLCKYSDNGGAHTKEEVDEYFAAYRSRSIDYPLFELGQSLRTSIERLFPASSPVYQWLKTCYRAARKRKGPVTIQY